MILLRIRYSNVGPERNAIQARERTLAARSSHSSTSNNARDNRPIAWQSVPVIPALTLPPCLELSMKANVQSGHHAGKKTCKAGA